jgi:exonuclease SbcC
MIKHLIIKDCLGITELAISPKKVNIISGGNEKGKTSILETIEKALFNTKRRAKFVRAGAEKAYIELDTDDGISIRRTVKEDEAGLDAGSVKVTKDGQPIKAPETFLKELFGSDGKRGHDVFAFNPVDFMQKKDTEQTDILLGLLPIKVTAQDAQAWFGEAPKVNYEKHGLQVLKDLEQWFYDARREANARVKAVEDECAAVTKRLPDNYKLEEWIEINLGQLFAEFRDAEEVNRDIKVCSDMLAGYNNVVEVINNKYALKEKEVKEYGAAEFKKAKDAIETQKNDLRQQIETIDAQIQELEKQKIALKTNIKNLDALSLAEKKQAMDKVIQVQLYDINENKKGELAKLETKKKQAEFFIEVHQPIDTNPIKERCAQAEQMKSYIPLAKEVEALRQRLEAEIITAQRYDHCVDTARLKPHELLTKVELPIKGLGVDGKGIVTINNLPLSNLSTSQQVRTCLDIARVLAKDNPLKLICVDKLEHLDETVREEFLKQIGETQGFQFFVTVVTDGDLLVEVK